MGTSATPVQLVDPDTGRPYRSNAPSALPEGTDRSGSITAANVAQDVAPANSNRVGLTFQNTSDTAMRLTESGNDATASNGYLIGAGVSVNVSTNKRVSVFCTLAGKTFSATEY